LVKQLGARLREDGIDARLDAWHLNDGVTIAEFMNREVRQAARILVVCSPKYRAKVHAMEEGELPTGSGWEHMLVTPAIIAGGKKRDQISVVLFRGTWNESAPDFLLGLPYVDLTSDEQFEVNYA